MISLATNRTAAAVPTMGLYMTVYIRLYMGLPIHPEVRGGGCPSIHAADPTRRRSDWAEKRIFMCVVDDLLTPLSTHPALSSPSSTHPALYDEDECRRSSFFSVHHP